MQKKNLCICLLGLAVLLNAPSAWAQGKKGAAKATKEVVTGEAAMKASKASKAKASKLEKQLNQRVKTTYKEINTRDLALVNTTSIEKKTVDMQEMQALKEQGIPADINPRELYPNAPEGLTKKSLLNYMLTKNNLEVKKFLAAEAKRSEQITELTKGDFLKKIGVGYFITPEKEASWLASQLKSDTQYLMIGTEEEAATVQKAVADIIKEVRTANPKREIFLFKEEETAGVSSLEDFEAVMSKKNPISDAARAVNIPVVELDPFPFGKGDIWQTVEGTRLVNEDWLKTIRQFRQNHPDALFIIQTPRGRVSYDEPYSLGSALSKEKTFVIELGESNLDRLTEHVDNDGMNNFLRFYDMDHFKQLERLGYIGDAEATAAKLQAEKNRVLRIEDPQAARLFGFDARIGDKKSLLKKAEEAEIYEAPELKPYIKKGA
ncbi:MAG: hypothetical protein IKO35_06335 [Elusimicrobiaceae bacterium]|nr:hypothetical protein [Elusimicrobiaceae bacterium]